MRRIKITCICVESGERTIKKGHRIIRSRDHPTFEGFRGGAYICVLHAEFIAIKTHKGLKVKAYWKRI